MVNDLNRHLQECGNGCFGLERQNLQTKPSGVKLTCPKHVIFMSKCLEVLTGGRSMPGKCLRDVALRRLAGCEMGLTLESEEGALKDKTFRQNLSGGKRTCPKHVIFMSKCLEVLMEDEACQENVYAMWPWGSLLAARWVWPWKAKKEKFHTCGGPRRRPCLGQGRGRRIIYWISIIQYSMNIILHNDL